MEYRGKRTRVLLVELEIVTTFLGRQSDNLIKIKNTYTFQCSYLISMNPSPILQSTRRQGLMYEDVPCSVCREENKTKETQSEYP